MLVSEIQKNKLYLGTKEECEENHDEYSHFVCVLSSREMNKHNTALAKHACTCSGNRLQLIQSMEPILKTIPSYLKKFKNYEDAQKDLTKLQMDSYPEVKIGKIVEATLSKPQ